MNTLLQDHTTVPSLEHLGATAGPALGAPRARTVVTWVLQLGLAGMFLMAGSMKLGGDPALVAAFEQIGVGQWFRYVTGAIEVGSALALLHPALAFYGAVLLVPTMVGAVITHLFVIGGSPAIPAGLLLASAAVVVLRRPR
ncbi:MAG: DoxX family protein [Vicinamibacterales bacterium]